MPAGSHSGPHLVSSPPTAPTARVQDLDVGPGLGRRSVGGVQEPGRSRTPAVSLQDFTAPDSATQQAEGFALQIASRQFAVL